MKKIAITTKHDLRKDREVLPKIIKFLQKKEKTVLIDKNCEINLLKTIEGCGEYDFKEKIDLLIVVGGDGTALRAVRALEDLKTPLLGINTGTLGFLSEVGPDEFENACEQIWQGEFTVDSRMLLAVEIVRRGKVVHSFRALNEVVIDQKNVSRLIELSTYVDDAMIAKFRADGFIVATPTGSTAHSLSAGGPILHPKMEAFVLTPISPHSFNQKPIVITPEKIIEVKPTGRNRENNAVTIDGQISEELKKGDTVKIYKYSKKAKFLRLLHENFFSTIKIKLGWGKSFKKR